MTDGGRSNTAIPPLARNSAVLMVSQVLTLAGSFVVSVVLARALGPAGKGLFTLLQLLPSLLYMIASIGLPSAVVYVAAQSPDSARTISRQAVRITLLAQSAVFLAYVLLSPLLSPVFFDGIDPLLTIAAGAVSLSMGAAQVAASRLVAAGRTVRSVIPNLLAQLGLVLSVLFLLLVARVTLSGVAIVWVSLAFMSAVALLSMQQRADRAHSEPVDLGVTRSRLLGYGVKAWLANALTFLNYRQDMFLVALFHGARAVGLYSIGVTFAELIWYVPNAVSGALFPKAAYLDDLEAADLSARTTRVTLMITVLILTALAAAVPFAVPVIFGEEFHPSILAFYALVPGTLLMVPTKVLSSHLAGRGQVHYSTISSGSNLAVNLAANLVLIPRLGIVGAGLASSISYAVSCAIMTVAFRRETGLGVGTLYVFRRGDVILVKDSIGGLLQRTRLALKRVSRRAS